MQKLSNFTITIENKYFPECVLIFRLIYIDCDAPSL